MLPSVPQVPLCTEKSSSHSYPLEERGCPSELPPGPSHPSAPDGCILLESSRGSLWRPQGWEFSRSRPLQIVNYFKGLHPPCKRQPKLPVGTAVQPLGSQPLLLGGWHLAWIKYPGHHRVQSQQVLSKLPVGLCPVFCMGAGVSLSASAEGAKTTGQLTGSWGWSLALNVRPSLCYKPSVPP